VTQARGRVLAITLVGGFVVRRPVDGAEAERRAHYQLEGKSGNGDRHETRRHHRPHNEGHHNRAGKERAMERIPPQM